MRTFAPHLSDNASVNPIKEVWVSGGNQQFAKLPCEFIVPGVRIPQLPQT